jgi:hypothetical protein
VPLTVVGHKAMTIPSGGSTSNSITDFDDAWGLTIYSPVIVTATAFSVEVEPTSSGTLFVVLQSGGTDVTIPASRATVISPVPFRQMRITSSSVEGQDDVFKITRTIVV